MAAKSLILLRTTPMPRSSEAFSSITRCFTSSGPACCARYNAAAAGHAAWQGAEPDLERRGCGHMPYSWRAMASAVEVFPVPGGP